MANHELTDAECYKLLAKFNISATTDNVGLLKAAYSLGLHRDIMHVSYKELKQAGQPEKPA